MTPYLIANCDHSSLGKGILRSVGRLYPGEKLPRWNRGLLRRRDGEPLWNGPPDPILAPEPDADRSACATIELPEISRVDRFLTILSCIQRAALACGLQALVLTGATPPADATLELTPVTPDPAVIEINSAPSRNCSRETRRSCGPVLAGRTGGLQTVLIVGALRVQAGTLFRTPRFAPREVELTMKTGVYTN